MEGLTQGCLFSGIGGFELAAQSVGIKTLWSNEIDSYCCKILRKHFNHEIIEKDIREVGKENLQPVDIISGGFPCQPVSQAGKRQGENDDRYLWPEMFRVIKELGPTYVVGENVFGITSMGHGKPLEEILQSGVEGQTDIFNEESEAHMVDEERGMLAGIINDLESIGYNVETYAIPACSVGAWHRRERIWILAYSGCEHGTGSPVKRKSKKATQGEKASKSKRSAKGHGVRSNTNSNDLRSLDRGSKKDATQKGKQAQPKSSAVHKDVSDSNNGGDEQVGRTHKPNPETGRIGGTNKRGGGADAGRKHKSTSNISDSTNTRSKNMRKQKNQTSNAQRDKSITHTPSKRLEGGIGRSSKGKGLNSNSKKTIPNSTSKRSQGIRTKRKQESKAHGQEGLSSRRDGNRGVGEAKSGLGRMVDGLPEGLDEAVTWDIEPNIPKVANKISGRVNRLKGLGNAIVPQVAVEIYKAIINHYENES